MTKKVGNANMAAYQLCFRRIFKLNNRILHLTAITESDCFVLPSRLGTRRSGSTILHNLTKRKQSLISSIVYSKERSHGGEGERGRKRCLNFSIIFVPAVFKEFFGFGEKEGSTPEDDLINRIKKCIYYKQIGEVEKAERLLHIALKMAQDQKHEKGITYVYDIMANLAFENEEFSKAQKLFVEVLRRLISNGLPQDDIIVINISLKIADTFAALEDYEKSEQGFLFCLDTLKKKMSAGAQDEDLLVLYCQCLDRYSLFLLQSGRLNEAVQHIESAVDVAVSIFGHKNNKVGAILLSDMGVIKSMNGEKDTAAQCFDEALKIAKEDVDTSTALIMVNRGLALKESGAHEEGKHWCELGLKHALLEKSKAIQKAAKECLRANSENKHERQKQSSRPVV